MSYILDALKRADAERGRGSVPGLHAQPLPGEAPERKGTRIALRTGLGVAIVLALAGVAAGTWVWRTQAGGKPTPVAVTAGPVTPPAMPQTAPAPEVTPPAALQPPVAPPQPAQAAPNPPARRVEQALPAAPAARASAAALIAPAPSVSIPAKSKAQAGPVSATASAPVTATTATTATATPSATTTAPATSSTGAIATAPATKPASAAAVAPAIAPLLSELPEEVRRLIPALAITGAVYSENPAQRLLLVNGQVLPQGASAASEVSIEEIRPRSATFSFRGTRFRVTY